MKTTKRILSLLLVALLTFSGFAISANAANIDGDYEYTVSNNQATITKYNGSATSLTIPKTLGGYAVVRIKEHSFSNCKTLTNLTIPYGVQSIGYYAFSDNTALKSVKIPGTVTMIGSTGGSTGGAFYRCNKLQTVILEEGNEDAVIGIGCFKYCESLLEIVIPGNYTTICEDAFSNCISLKKVQLKKSDSVFANQIIDYGAFSGCSSLSQLDLPTTLRYIGPCSFSKCTSLTNLVIPEGVKSIGYYAFSDNTALKSVKIPGTVTKIGSTGGSTGGAFYRCNKLQTVILEEGNEDAVIGIECFKYCESLLEIVIPGNYTTICEDAFSNCISLKKVQLKKSDSVFANQIIDYGAFSGCSSLSQLDLPTTLRYIGPHSFSRCTSLTNLVIPEGVESIGYYAFSDNTALKTVKIPGTVTLIGSTGGSTGGAFYGCNKLQTVILEEGNQDAKIAYGCFNKCSSLTTVHIPSNYTVIYDDAFSGCSKVTICNNTSNCYAKKYADNKNIPFKICSDNHESNVYSVNFIANGGSVSPSNVSVGEGLSVILPTPTKEGYTCLGWSTSSSASSAKYACGESYQVNSNITFYAVWEQNKPEKIDKSIEINYKGSYTVGYNDFTPVEYYTSNPTVATVSNNGTIYGASCGTAYVHAVDANGNEKVTEVNVNYSVIQWIIVIILFGWIWY